MHRDSEDRMVEIHPKHRRRYGTHNQQEKYWVCATRAKHCVQYGLSAMANSKRIGECKAGTFHHKHECADHPGQTQEGRTAATVSIIYDLVADSHYITKKDQKQAHLPIL